MYVHIKRIMDFCIALMMIIVLSPLMVCATIMIKSCKDGPVLFKQERPGKNEKLFMIYKFRTMSVQTKDESGNPLSDFERTSKVGRILRKTSVDELPQLFNILRGEMSYIGPRPLLTEYLPLYNEQQKKRHNVLPGISGWAQVNGRNALTWEEKFDYDVYYAEHIGFLLDLKIFFMTIMNVIKQDGINNTDDNTMERFKGTKQMNKEI